jgi:hypothetical protein
MAYKFQIGDSIVSGSLTRDAGNITVRNHAGVARGSISIAGVVSGSGEATFGSIDSDGEIDAGSYAIGGTDVINGSRQLQNIASLDATTEASIEGAIDTLANLASMGTNGAELEALGSLDVAQGLKINNVATITAGRAVQASSVSGSGAVSGASFGSDGNMTLGGNAIVAALSASAASSVLSLGVNSAAQITSAGVGTLASLTIGGQSVIDSSRNATKFNNISGSGTFNLGGTVRLDGVAAATLAEGADSFYFLDADDKLMKSQAVGDVVSGLAGAGLLEVSDKFAVRLGTNGGVGLGASDALFLTASALAAANVVAGADQMLIFNAAGVAKRESLTDYATALAGAGLSASGGVLSTQAGAVNPVSDVTDTLAEGYNYLTGTAGAAVKLPIDASIGDVIHVKNSTAGVCTINRQSNHTVDGLNSIVLESARGAVSMVYALTSSWLLV